MPGGGVYYNERFHLLYVKIDYIAALRQALGGNEPDPAACAIICEKSGCDGITVHLRRDRRHIQDRDVFAVRDAIRGRLNLEMALSDEIIRVAKKVKPNQVTIAPEKRGKIAAQGGLDVRLNMADLKDTVKLFHDENILVSLSVDPDKESIELSKQCGADFVEIHTGKYGNAINQTEIDREIEKIYRAANHAVKVGIKVSAGHGLNYSNILPVLKARALEEVNIGYSIISRSVFVGLSKAVEEMLEILC